MERYYRPHHRRLERAVDSLLAHGPVLVIDGHSYPKIPLPYEQDSTVDRGQICIGTDAFHTPAAVVEQLSQHFREGGFSVSVDTPFSGALVPLKHYGRNAQVSSVVLEVRRDVYMDEESGEKIGTYVATKRLLAGALLRLIQS